MCCKSCNCRKVVYVVGVVLLVVGMVNYMVGFFSGSWVLRTDPKTQTARTVASYGLWEACDPDNSCGTLFERIPSVESAARSVQALMTVSIILFVLCLAVEILRLLPVLRAKRCRVIFDNRLIEYVISIAAVAGFLGMLIFAGEVKGAAPREIGQQDETGQGFGIALSGLLTVVIGCCVMAIGRDVTSSEPGEWATPRPS